MHDDLSTDHPSSFLPDPNDGAAPASTESPRSHLPLGDHGTADRICPFLRAAADGGALGPPVESPDAANRCVALDEAVPQSLRQQDLVCLSTAHVNCPRYLRGSVGLPAPVEPVTATRTVTPATAAALALFGLAFVVSVGFVVATGGLTVTAAAPTATQGGAVLGEVDAPSGEVSTPEPTIEPTPLPTPTAAATASPSPSPSPTPEPTAKPKPTSDRYALLKPCPKTPDCYIYVVRSGDNLFSIAKYFGVPLKTVQAMNPWTQSGLVAGRDLRIPTPTR